MEEMALLSYLLSVALSLGMLLLMWSSRAHEEKGERNGEVESANQDRGER